eukprot:g18194.t1
MSVDRGGRNLVCRAPSFSPEAEMVIAHRIAAMKTSTPLATLKEPVDFRSETPLMVVKLRLHSLRVQAGCEGHRSPPNSGEPRARDA